jgi:hypothetical protein
LISPTQPYTVAGSHVHEAEPEALYRREATLMTRVKRQTRGGVRILQIVPL